MIITLIKGIALTASLLLGGAPVTSTDFVPQGSSLHASAADQAAAEAAVQAIEDEVGHDLVNLDFDGDSVVLRPVDSFDEENDQEAFSRITEALRDAGYENIAAVSKGLVAERPALDPAVLATGPVLEDREAAAEAAVQAIEDEVGHDLVNLDFDGDSVVLRPVDSFDEENDQEAFSRITEALRDAGYENIAAVSKPLYFEEAPELDLDSLTTEEDVDIEAVALPEVDPAYSHVIRA